MTTKAFGVIGAAYGDEGKGLVTDFLAHRALAHGSAIVARFNGGAQAGHTVQLPNGVRHVFHHWGSGALAGASTYLGSRFAVHPLLWRQETERLADLGACLELYVDPRAPITLPSDVMINQAIEAARGQDRHGSCGVGFGEACERLEHEGMALTVGELAGMSDDEALGKMKAIVAQHVPARLKALGLPADALEGVVDRPVIWERFLDDCRCFLLNATLATPGTLAGFDTVIFEGAQGLALDEELGDFPYVTRSKTGLPYLVELAEEAGLSEVEVLYLTRAYTTRHGAGPLPFECGHSDLGRILDATNVPNDYQGTLRFAPLQPLALLDRIRRDRQRIETKLKLTFGLAMGCLDQVDSVKLPDGSAWSVQEASTNLARLLNAETVLESHGPSRATMNLALPCLADHTP